MPKQISLSIDNIRISAPENIVIVEAAKRAGIDIPVFCFHPKLKSVGMCRVCLVEIGRPVIDRATGAVVTEADGTPKIQYGQKLETACTTPISEGMVVLTNSERAKAARNEILEFLLTSHPLDCPICDKGGECPLQNLTLAYGPGKSRFRLDEKKHLAKNLPLGDLIYLDRERCIQCGRCIRFQTEVVDDPVIGFYQRGRDMQIITQSEPGFDSYFSGNTTDICPVGALTTTDFRFGARPWELDSFASLCTHCSVGCNLTVDVRREAKSGGGMAIKRIMPRQNESVNGIWLCDKGRFAHHFTDTTNRILKPLVRKGNKLITVSLDAALDLVASKFKARNQKLVTLVGGRLANEDLFNLKQLTENLHGKAYLIEDIDGGDITREYGFTQGSSLADLKKGSVILVIASDLHEEAPIYWLRVKEAVARGATLIVVNPRATRLDKIATHSIRYRYGEEILNINRLIPGEIKDPHPAVQVIKKAQDLVVLVGSEGLDRKSSRFVLESAARLLNMAGFSGKTGSGLMGIWQNANTQGAWEIGLEPIGDLERTIRGANILLIAGVDPLGDHPEILRAIQAVKFIVVFELALTNTARYANVVIPVQAFTEREGTFTSAERRVQAFHPAMKSNHGILPDYTIAARLAERIGSPLPGETAPQVFEQITEKIASFKGLSYEQICEAPKQWPLVGGNDRYFGGTAYRNYQGVGVQLALLPQRKLKGVALKNAIQQPAFNEKNLWAVPVTRLYDRGNTLLFSRILQERLAGCDIRIHPDTAALNGIISGLVLLSVKKIKRTVNCILDNSVPRGFVLVPRSVGIPINTVTAVRLMPGVKAA